MALETCPQCGNETLRTDNVMGSTQTIHRRCGNCCYSDRQRYEQGTGVLIGEVIVDKKLKWKRGRNPVMQSYICKCGKVVYESDAGVKFEDVISYDKDHRFIGATRIAKCPACAKEEKPVVSDGLPKTQSRLF